MEKVKLKRFLYIYLTILVIVINWKFRSITEIQESIQMIKGPYFNNYNLYPFKTILMYLKRGTDGNTSQWLLQNIIGNTLFFIPIGFVLPMVYEKADFKKTSLFGLCLTLSIEVFQLITKLGSFDVDDIILNLAGVMIGYGIYTLKKNIYTKKEAN